jgi:predicted nucleic acid-binding protein
VGIVLDSTVLIAAERVGQNPRSVIGNMLARMGDTEATLSVITVVELAHGIERANSAARQIARENFLNELLNEISVEPVTIPIALRAGKLDGNLESKGIRIALGDLLIGATALEIGYSVVTNNLRHFQMIPDLIVNQL